MELTGIAALHPSYEATNLAIALPDQDQADGGEHGAISGPLQLIDHEARWRPGNHAGALTDPQQADDKRQKADDRKRSGHGFPLVAACARWFPDSRPLDEIASGGHALRSNTMPVSAARPESRRGVVSRGRSQIQTTKKPRTMPGLSSC